MGMKQKRRRKCRSCGELYRPDHRNIHHQVYCGQEACRLASKRVSQRRWLNRASNRDYHRGNAAVERVRSWRKARPGYWRRKPPALQDHCQNQATPVESLTVELSADNSQKPAPLQEFCLAQDPLFVGLMAHLTGALQEDIEPQLSRFQAHGMTILRKGPGIEPENDHDHTQAGAMRGTDTLCAQTV